MSTCKNRGQKVNAYIDNEGNWRKEDIRRDFLPYEAEEILATTIAKEGIKDRRYWKLHPKGRYTVSTGYALGLDIKNKLQSRDKPECSGKNKRCWTQIWTARVPSSENILVAGFKRHLAN